LFQFLDSTLQAKASGLGWEFFVRIWAKAIVAGEWQWAGIGDYWNYELNLIG
jgi:hypothetical protein